MPRASHARRLLAALVLVSPLACLRTAGTANVVQQASDPETERLARFAVQVEALRAKLGVPGLSAGILRDGRLVWARGFGYADAEARIPATDTTPYPVASLTQPFTSTLLLRLVEQGAVSLDDPVRKYTDEIPETRARVRHVASMTSKGTPGTRFEYDGVRFDALADVIERATRQPFRALLAGQILEPLRLRHTVPGADIVDSVSRYAPILGDSTIERYRATLARLARPYRQAPEAGRAPGVQPPRHMSASAGLVSTVRDLAAFDSAVDASAFVRPGTQQLAWSPAVSSGGGLLPYGLGWFVSDYRWQRYVWHGGSWQGAYSSLILKSPANRLTLILLANSDALSVSARDTESVETNPIACEFLRMFVVEPQIGRRLPDPVWTADASAAQAEIERVAAAAHGYDYACERRHPVPRAQTSAGEQERKGS